MKSPPEVTQLLRRWSGGEAEALDELLPLLYEELKRLAQARMREERPDLTLSPTALVHEAYLRLVDLQQIQWVDRQHFLAVAARQMRRILVDEAKRRHAAKRGGGAHHTGIDVDSLALEIEGEHLSDLDEALQKLEHHYPRPVRAIELHYFGGLTLEETAAALNVSLSTVVRDLRFAEAWLGRLWKGPVRTSSAKTEPD